MKKSISELKKSDIYVIAKSHKAMKRISEREILRRAYEIYMETGVPCASEIESLAEVEEIRITPLISNRL